MYIKFNQQLLSLAHVRKIVSNSLYSKTKQSSSSHLHYTLQYTLSSSQKLSKSVTIIPHGLYIYIREDGVHCAPHITLKQLIGHILHELFLTGTPAQHVLTSFCSSCHCVHFQSGEGLFHLSASPSLICDSCQPCPGTGIHHLFP